MQLKLKYEPPSISLLDLFLSRMMGTGQDILLSRDGIIFPKCLSLALHFRLCRSWTDISQILVKWHNNLSFYNSDALILKFRSGGVAKLCLGGSSLRAIEKLLLSIDIWATQSVKSDQFLDLKEAIQTSLNHAGLESYTDLWEEELNRRFSNTVFVPLSPGTYLQNRRLQILSQLAFGGFSAVYMVKDRQNKAMVLKELVIPNNLGVTSSEQVRSHFSREAKILSQLNHEQLVNILDFFVEEGRNYLLLEYVPGQNLRHIVHHGGIKESIAIDWAIQMCQILEYLHEQSPPVIHRDFTPENLIVNPAEKVILIDFNAAFELLCTTTSTIVGKYAYMAPEQFRGHSEVASDLYSLGCVLFFLLTGQDPEPISANSPREIRADISQEIDDLVVQLTQFDSSLRPRSASTVKNILENMLSN